MNIYQLTKKDIEGFSFQQGDNSWALVFENNKKEGEFKDFCIDLLQKAELRKPYTDNFYNEKFSEGEVSFLIKYFSTNGFFVKRRNTVLEQKLKQALAIISPDNTNDVAELINEMSYHDQLELADKITKA